MLRKVALLSGLVVLFYGALFTTNGCGGGAVQLADAIVEGRVFDAATDQPLDRASVWAMGEEYLTDAKGYYRIENLYASSYTIRAQKSGYAAVNVDLDLHSGVNRQDIPLRRQ